MTLGELVLDPFDLDVGIVEHVEERSDGTYIAVSWVSRISSGLPPNRLVDRMFNAKDVSTILEEGHIT